MTYSFPSINQLHELLVSNKASSVEITQDCLNRARSIGTRLNCFANITEDRALEEARIADANIRDGKITPLTGVPLAHKDNFCVQGTLTTCSSPMLQSFEAPYDAAVVENLRDAGAVCIGKTNMDEFAMGSSNETSTIGSVRNPWNLGLVPGGSSGGSAASVAAGIVPATTGSDTGGSIRQPAAFCGVTGLKPTYGVNSRFGLVALASSLDQPGSFTRSVVDALHMLRAMSKPDSRDSTQVPRPNYSYSSISRPLHIGFSPQHFAEVPASMGSCLGEAQKTMECQGHHLIEIELSHFELAVPVYYVISRAEAATNLSRFDGIRYGHQATDQETLEAVCSATRGEGFGGEVKLRILTGASVLAKERFDSHFLKAQQIRRLIQLDFQRAFESVDLILLPSTPTLPFPLQDVDQTEDGRFFRDKYTVAANLAGIPALSIPCGLVEKLPVGVQIVAPQFHESSMLSLGIQFQEVTDWHNMNPSAST